MKVKKDREVWRFKSQVAATIDYSSLCCHRNPYEKAGDEEEQRMLY